jgi:hypothetical protein
MTPEEEYEYLKANDPDFEKIRAKLVETIKEEQPEAEEIYGTDHRAFLDGYRRVKRAHFNPFPEDLVERSRRGDIDASKEMLIEAGIIDQLKSTE